MNNVVTLISASVLTLALALTSGVAQASPTTFDFGAAAAGHEQGNPSEIDSAPTGLRFDGSGSVFTDGFTGSGLQIIATGQNTDASPGSSPFAYLDGPFNGRRAGLGVCQGLDGDNECVPNDDDNVTANEQLTLKFNSSVTLSDLVFKGEKHYGLGTGHHLAGTDTLLLNGTATTFADAESDSLTDSEFTFAYGGDNPKQFYVGTATATATRVPAPTAIGLLAFALLGLAGVIRRRRVVQPSV